MKLQSYFFFILFCFVITSCTKKENPEPIKVSGIHTGFTQVFGGNKTERIIDILVADNQVLVLGFTESYGNGKSDVLLVSYSQWGNMQWYKTYGSQFIDEGTAICKTSDGNYLISGITANGTDYDGYAIKINKTGDIVWEKIIDKGFDEKLFGVTEQSGAYYFAGLQDKGGNANLFLEKVGINGNEIWSKIYGGNLNDAGGNLIAASNGNLLTMGMTYSYGFGDRDVWMFEFNQNGDSVNSMPIGTSAYEQPGNFIQANNGNYLISYHTAGIDPIHNLGANSLNINLTTNWKVDTGTTVHEGGEDVCETEAGYVFAGNTGAFVSGENDIYLVYTDFNGVVTQTKTIALPGDQWLKGIAYHDGWIYLAASDNRKGNYDFLLMKMKP